MLDFPPLSIPTVPCTCGQQNVGPVTVASGLCCCNNMGEKRDGEVGRERGEEKGGNSYTYKLYQA